MSEKRRGLAPEDREYVIKRDRYRCADCGLTFHPDDLQVDHDQEVADNGPHHRGNYVTRCAPREGGGCHRAKTSRNTTARAARRAATMPATSSTRTKPKAPPPAPPSPYRWVTLPLTASPLVYGGGVLLDQPGQGQAGAAGLVAMTMLVSGRQALSRKRRAIAQRLADVVAADLHNTPGVAAVRVTKWRRLSPVALYVTHGHLLDPGDPQDRVRIDGAVALLSRKSGVDLVLDRVDEKRDRLYLRARVDADPLHVETVISGPEADPTRQRIDEAVRGFISREPVAIRWLGEDDVVGPVAFAVSYPSTFRDDSADARLGLLDRVNEKAPGRWRADWDGQANEVQFTRRPAAEPSQPRPPRPPDMPWWLLRLGLDEDGREVRANLKVTPHLLVVGGTGGGKTVSITGLVSDWLAQGLDCILVDGKGPALSGYRHRKEVIAGGYGEPEDMSDAMIFAEELVRDRYRRVMAEGLEADEFDPVLVVLDEAAEFAINVAKWWKAQPRPPRAKAGEEQEQRPRDAPALDSWSSVTRIGRECGVHMIVGLQQAAAAFFGASEARDNLAGRLGMGSLSRIGADMTFERVDVGRDVPKEPPGRGTWMPGTGSTPGEVQMYWTPRPKPSGHYHPDHAEHLTRLLGPAVVGSSGPLLSVLEAMGADRDDPADADLTRVRVVPDPPITALVAGDHIEVDGVRGEFVGLDEEDGAEQRDLDWRVDGVLQTVGAMEASDTVACWR